MPLLAVNGTTLFYDLSGPEGAPVVVFSNSLGSTAEMWDAQARALAGRCRILRYDTRGHGRSQTTGPVRLETLVKDVIGLMDALAIPSAHMVGLSLGGITAQGLGIHYPTRVRSLALMATASHFAPADAWLMRAKTVREEGLGSIVDAAMTRWFTQGADQHCPERKRFTRQRFLSSDAEGYALCCEALAAADVRADLARITAPTLVMAAEGDPVTTVSMGLELASAIAEARFEPVSEAAHLFAVEQPEQVNRHGLSKTVLCCRQTATIFMSRGWPIAKPCWAWIMCSAPLPMPMISHGHGRISSPAWRGARHGAIPISTGNCARPRPCR